MLVPRRHRPIDGLVVHQCVRLDPRDVTVARGIPVTTVALELYAMGSAGTKSRYEDAFLALVTPEPLVNMELHGYEVDFHWPDRRLAVEIDGNHSRPRDVRSDGARDRTLEAAGYTVLRFSGAQVEQRPGQVLNLLGVPAGRDLARRSRPRGDRYPSGPIV